MREKPMKIVKVAGGYHLLVNNIPVVQGDGGQGVTLDRARAGLSTSGFKGGYKPPLAVEPLLIKKAGDVAGLAHQVGRYMLNLGDFTSAYTDLVGIESNHVVWWDRTTR